MDKIHNLMGIMTSFVAACNLAGKEMAPGTNAEHRLGGAFAASGTKGIAAGTFSTSLRLHEAANGIEWLGELSGLKRVVAQRRVPSQVKGAEQTEHQQERRQCPGNG